MILQKSNASIEADSKLRRLLKNHDPAAGLTPEHCRNLEGHIAAKIANRPQVRTNRAPGDLVLTFPVPYIGSRRIPWPLPFAGVMALGLLLGFFISAGLEPQTRNDEMPRNDNLMTTMGEPWHQFTR